MVLPDPRTGVTGSEVRGGVNTKVGDKNGGNFNIQLSSQAMLS